MTDQSAEMPECREAFEAYLRTQNVPEELLSENWADYKMWQAGWNTRAAPAPAEAERGCDHIWAASNPDKTRRSEAVCAKCGISGHSASQPPQPATPAMGVDGVVYEPFYLAKYRGESRSSLGLFVSRSEAFDALKVLALKKAKNGSMDDQDAAKNWLGDERLSFSNDDVSYEFYISERQIKNTAQRPQAVPDGYVLVERSALEQVQMSISGGLCYRSAESKHAQLKDAELQIKTMLKAAAPEQGGGS